MLAFIKKNKKQSDKHVWVIAGTKNDLPRDYKYIFTKYRKVNIKEVEKFGKENGLVWDEISSFNRETIQKMFVNKILPTVNKKLGLSL
jgi:hypothetical protein